MNKRGQFYLIAAVIIVLIIIGISSVKTYTVIKSEPQNLKDLSAELSRETGKIIDYGVYNNDNGKIEDFLQNEYQDYFLKNSENTTIAFVYGNKKGDVTVSTYDKTDTGEIEAEGLSSKKWTRKKGTFVSKKIIPSGEETNVKIGNKDYKFNLKDNQMFYFVIIKEKDGEKYIEKN